MNCKEFTISVSAENHQVEEVVSSIIHTIMLFSTGPKVSFKEPTVFQLGAVGMIGQDCNYIDVDYVKVNSPTLTSRIDQCISAFARDIKGSNAPASGKIVLELFKKKQSNLPILFRDERMVWEMWTLHVNLLETRHATERDLMREQLSEAVRNELLHVTDTMLQRQYLPPVPRESELGHVFDLSYPDVHPYNWRLSHQVVSKLTSSASVGSSMRNFFKENFLY